MNQFHTPSFGDEVFELNDTPMEQTQHQNASRRLSRISSLDRVDDDDEEYDTQNAYANNLMSTSQQPQQQLLQQSPTTPHQVTQPQQAPAKPLAPYALFFRDTMTAIKQQNPACTLDQITEIALNMWESIDEKQKNVYEQRHEMEKRDYFRQLRDYQRNQQLGGETIATTAAAAQQPLSLPVKEEKPSVPTTLKTEPSDSPAPEQIQLLTEAAAVQKCTRDQCSKPAIINPDWEDEYCSNECVVIHCRNVFSEWARSLQNSPT